MKGNGKSHDSCNAENNVNSKAVGQSSINSDPFKKFEPCLAFLGALGFKKPEINSILAETLQKKIISSIPGLDQALLKDILSKTFDSFAVKDVREIVVCVLENMKVVPDEYICVFAKDTDKFSMLSLSAQRKIWAKVPSLFDGEALRYISMYLNDARCVNYFQQVYHRTFVLPKSWRRVNENLQNLAKLAGDCEVLYHRVTSLLWEKFQNDFDPCLSALRTDFTMAVSEACNPPFLQKDESFAFIACFDKCLTADKPNCGHLDDLTNVVLSVPKEQPIVERMAFCASHPLFPSFLCKEILFRLNTVVEKETLPKDDVALKFFSNLLLFSVSREFVIKNKIKTYPQNPVQLLTVFYPIVAQFILDAKYGKSSSVPASLRAMTSQYAVPRTVLQCFLVDLCARCDSKCLNRIVDLTDVLIDSDCFSFATQSFVNSFCALLKSNLKIATSLDVKIRLLKAVTFLAMYSYTAHLESLSLIVFCKEQNLLGKNPLREMFETLVFRRNNAA